MISNNTSFISTEKMTDRSVVVSACSLGLSAPLTVGIEATGVSGSAGAPAIALAGLPVLSAVERRNERPSKALEAGVAAAQAKAYAFAAASAGTDQQTQHHAKWAFRGLEPWSDPA
ncbi:hypothetical protein ACFYT4_27660 [Streptomyces sp. NPDC004609]|uniref:hypothetical protein n=1 Tax=Streptomyces sp. NPDC004609 TaxID=3364704 RepID=UPI0036D08948